jgi:hypothetical protein
LAARFRYAERTTAAAESYNVGVELLDEIGVDFHFDAELHRDETVEIQSLSLGESTNEHCIEREEDRLEIDIGAENLLHIRV